MNQQQDQIKAGTSAFLKRIREERELNQAQMARLMKYNLTGYNQLEKGHKFLTVVQLWYLGHVLNISPGDIINEICGADPSVEKSKLEKLQALLDSAMAENSTLKDKLIAALEGTPIEPTKTGYFVRRDDDTVIWRDDPEGKWRMGIDPHEPEG